MCRKKVSQEIACALSQQTCTSTNDLEDLFHFENVTLGYDVCKDFFLQIIKEIFRAIVMRNELQRLLFTFASHQSSSADAVSKQLRPMTPPCKVEFLDYRKDMIQEGRLFANYVF